MPSTIARLQRAAPSVGDLGGPVSFGNKDIARELTQGPADRPECVQTRRILRVISSLSGCFFKAIGSSGVTKYFEARFL